MKNIFKTQLYLCKQRKGLIGIIWVAAVAVFIFFLISKDSVADVFSNVLFPMFIISVLPAFMIASTYTEKIQIYEITSGYKPHEIIFGKTLTYLPFTILFLVVASVLSLIKFSTASTVVLLYCILTIRMTLCIIFLSPLTKECAWIPLFSLITATFFNDNMQALQNSPVSFLSAGQCVLLSQTIDNAFVLKVIISSIISCLICYFVGHIVVKKKFDLEPRK